MKWLFLCILLTLTGLLSFAQPLIHAHNDYQKPEALSNALRNKVFSIEVDIYLSGGRLLVAHDKKELDTAKALDTMYLLPIIELFRQHKGTISADSAYTPILMIDIKENGEAVITELVNLLAPHRSVFDRSVNAKAVKVVISGDRSASHRWTSYPVYIYFDGRPYETYDEATLQRVAFMSDSYFNYIIPKDSASRIEEVVKKVHGMGKLFRLWASPDNPASWKWQQQLGIDIINTDKVEECRNYFLLEKAEKNAAGN